MRKFLESVAEWYISRSSDCRDTTLVFPNKRSTLFMRRYIKRLASGPMFIPKMITIGSFFSKLNEGVEEADKLEQLFTLYDAYCEVECEKGQTPRSFDHFRFWGEIMLDDFDDIDRQLVDAQRLFANLASEHEMGTDFLTDEQREVARELFGYDAGERFDSFWRHYRQEGGEDVVYDGFRTLSELLGPIYRRFNEMLLEKNLVTRGRIARNAARHIVDALDTEGKLPERFGIIGFGVISAAERKVFDELKKSGRADFFWDIPSMLKRDMPADLARSHNAVAKYIAGNVKRYPMPEDYRKPRVFSPPGVEVISVPSNTMQAKVAGNILEALRTNGLINSSRADDTAVVIPDPALLVPMLYSLPPALGTVNVTMGLPMRNTPFATLLSAIIGLHSATRTDGDEPAYLTENVARILTHSSMSIIAAGEASVLRRYLERKPRYMTAVSTIRKYAPSLYFIFRPIPDNESAESAETYLNELIDGMTGLIKKNTTEASVSRDSHEIRILEALKSSVKTIIDMLGRHREITPDLNTSSMTFFRLVEKILRREVMNLSGSPLRGVQLMGVLETRSLDFTNVIMLSMNEKTFPPRRFIRSMIPNSMRIAYGMTKFEEREMEYTWIFANLLSRSKRVYLLFNAAADEEGNAGMSRYLYQVENLYTGLNSKRVSLFPSGAKSRVEDIVIDKTAVKKELDRFRPGGDLNLSASALKNYMNCPLKFYLSNVRRISESKEPSPSIDAASQGTIAHAALENLFQVYVVEQNGGWVNETLDVPVEKIFDEVVRQFDEKYYFGRFNGNVELMPGEARMLVDELTDSIKKIIEAEKARGPFKFVGAEVTPRTPEHPDRSFDWKITPELTVRFTYSIDRMDRLPDGRLRFIDYKTGSDSLKGGTLDDLFHLTDNFDNRNDAIFQLLTYAHAYSDFTGFDKGVVIELTKVFDPANSIGIPLKINTETSKYKESIEDHKSDVVAGFRERLENVVAEIFDENVDFCQAKDPRSCEFCQFLNICHRVVPEKKF